MTKLSKAQAKELELIQFKYSHWDDEMWNKEIQENEYKLEKAYQEKDEYDVRYYTEELKMWREHFILWTSKNSRTLEKLQELGYIQYVKNDKFAVRLNIDWVKPVDLGVFKEVQA